MKKLLLQVDVGELTSQAADCSFPNNQRHMMISSSLVSAEWSRGAISTKYF